MRIRNTAVCATVVCLAVVTALLLVQCSSEKVPYPGGEPPGLVPRLFAPGIVSTGHVEFSPAFSPDGRELYFTVAEPPAASQILFLTFDGGRWTEPAVAPFCSDFSEGTPAFSPDGQTLYFTSNRPIDTELQVIEPSNIWKVTRTKTGWSAPQELGPPINSNSYERSPSLARDGTMYFQSNVSGGTGDYDIYMAAFRDGHFTMPVNLGDAVNTRHAETDPCIARDQSYLVFCSYEREDGLGGGDLYVSFKNGGSTDANGGWSRAVNLGKAVNTEAEESFPTLSPDGKYMFFSSTRGGEHKYPDIYWVDAAVIEAAKQ